MKAKLTLVIEGANFNNLDGFYKETDQLLTGGGRSGRNLDAFNDLLRGGFGVFDYGSPIKIVWNNFARSKQQLGRETTDTLVEIIRSHEHIEFEKR